MRKIYSFPLIIETCLSWPFSWIWIAGVWDGSQGLENLGANPAFVYNFILFMVIILLFSLLPSPLLLLLLLFLPLFLLLFLPLLLLPLQELLLYTSFFPSDSHVVGVSGLLHAFLAGLVLREVAACPAEVLPGLFNLIILPSLGVGGDTCWWGVPVEDFG